jgi:hypothetical protein
MSVAIGEEIKHWTRSRSIDAEERKGGSALHDLPSLHALLPGAVQCLTTPRDHHSTVLATTTGWAIC